VEILSQIQHLYAGKPQAFGPRKSSSSIIKQPHKTLNITFDGSLEDEQGNKKLHGGPYMALHQFSQQNYSIVQDNFPDTPQPIEVGTIGENISAPNMNERNVFIGDKYQVGNVILQVVSPRAPCSKINHRYGQRRIDLFIAENALTGWYYSVLQEGEISVGDNIELFFRDKAPISIEQIWQIRYLKLPVANEAEWLALATQTFHESALAPEWKEHISRVIKKLTRTKN